MSRLDSVVFFSKNDGAGNYMLEKAEHLLENEINFSEETIDSLLEFHHVHKYFENGLFLSRWTPAKKQSYMQTVKAALSEIKDRFIKLGSSQLIETLKDIAFENQGNFWELFRLYETYKKIERPVFSEALSNYKDHIRYILTFKQIVEHFNNEIRLFLLSYENSAELLLSHFEEKGEGMATSYHFPKSLTDKDKHEIILAYLDTEDPNLNYIDLISNSKNLKLTPKIFLKAKQKSQAVQDIHFNEENSTRISVGTSLKMDQTEPVIFEKSGTDTTVTYGGLYLDSLLSNSALFATFKTLFAYLDSEGLITLYNKDAEMDNLEKVFMRSKNEYQKGFHFSHKDMLSLGQLGILSHYLNRQQKSTETLIESFVKEYFIEHFKMSGLEFKMPNADLPPSDKIRLIAPEMEYLLKQFRNFVLDGEINHELLQIDSSPIYFSEIPSLVNKKYITSSHDTIKKMQYYFFDPHGILSARKGKGDRRNLFQILLQEPVIKSKLENYQIHFIDLIIEEGFVKENEKGELEMINPITILLAGKLKKNGAISYWHCSSGLRMQIDYLLSMDIMQITSNLFNEQEISYLNYYLNKKEFSNGHDLRNKYLHGSNNRTEERQKMDYMYFQRTLILILLKIKDDLELKAFSVNLSQN